MNKFKLKKNTFIKFEVLLLLIALLGFPFMIGCLILGMKLAEYLF